MSQKIYTTEVSENFSPTAGNFKRATTEQRTNLVGIKSFISRVGHVLGSLQYNAVTIGNESVPIQLAQWAGHFQC